MGDSSDHFKHMFSLSHFDTFYIGLSLPSIRWSVQMLKHSFIISCLPSSRILCEISSFHGGEYDVQSCLLGYTVRTSETSVDNNFTRQYISEDNSEHHVFYLDKINSESICFKEINTNTTI
jgi:hypothetical protein